MTAQTRSVTFTQAVLLRPAMYTLNGTLSAIVMTRRLLKP